MTRLIPCTSCQSHVMESDASCPHCGETLRSKSGPRPGWVLFSLAMTGCPSVEDVYGCPDPCGPDPDTATASETNTDPTDSGTDTDTGTDTGTDGTDTGTEGTG